MLYEPGSHKRQEEIPQACSLPRGELQSKYCTSGVTLAQAEAPVVVYYSLSAPTTKMSSTVIQENLPGVRQCYSLP